MCKFNYPISSLSCHVATDCRNLNFMLIKDEQKNSHERRKYELVAGKQQLNTTRTKLHPLVIQ